MYQYPKQILTIEKQIQSYIDTDKIAPLPTHNGLYQILLAMKYLRPSDGEWKAFVNRLEKLFQNNRNVIRFSAMNFPTNWKVHLSV